MKPAQDVWPRVSVRRLAGAVRVALLACALGAACWPAQAGLFDDEEARKAIVELRARVSQGEEENKARLAELTTTKTQLTAQLDQLRRTLLEMSGQLDALRSELARMRGNDEQRAKELADLQRLQKDLAQGMDERLRRFEPMKVTLDGREWMVDPAEKRAFDEAIAVIRTGDFDKAVAALGAFQRRYPDSAYTDATRFWLGNALYGKRDYKEAISTFRAFVVGAPAHPRAPEALLALANSQAELKDPRSARRTLEELIKSYPQSEAAQAGKERLASIR
jgi:tol-pal system protein YbgF